MPNVLGFAYPLYPGQDSGTTSNSSSCLLFVIPHVSQCLMGPTGARVPQICWYISCHLTSKGIFTRFGAGKNQTTTGISWRCFLSFIGTLRGCYYIQKDNDRKSLHVTVRRGDTMKRRIIRAPGSQGGWGPELGDNS